MATSGELAYQVSGKDANATGGPTERGFLVQAGSHARKEVVPSGADSVAPVRRRLIESGVLVDEGDRLRFAKDHFFNSPSGAATAVLGRHTNGWLAWRLPDGRTLSEMKRISRAITGFVLDDATRRRIIETHERLSKEGKLPTPPELDQEYGLFRKKFGPEALALLDGEALLDTMHDSGNRDSLVYWLEFKNDEEFQTKWFGSIAGGSALKFRIFRRKETGEWQAGDESNKPRNISLQRAIEIARSHRDQLLRGVGLLKELSDSATDDDYAMLQDGMDESAPDVSRLAWGHKYFSLLYPDKLDDYHSPEWQRYLLLKLLQLPPEGDGRYICAGRFISAAREVDIPIANFDHVLTTIFGSLHRYWRVGTRSSDSNLRHWDMMRERNCIAVGWKNLDDLSWVEQTKASREKLKEELQKHHPNAPSQIGHDCSQITNFVAAMSEGDIVLAADGATVLGIGRVTGAYQHHPEFEFSHQRGVEWLHVGEWKMPVHEGLRSTLRELRRHPENLLETERLIRSASIMDGVNGAVSKPAARPIRLTGVARRIESILERKGQAILYGPPGTGKTYWAERTAYDLAAISEHQKLFEDLDPSERKAITGDVDMLGQVRLCCFHPAYGYEDFLEGYRPQTINGQISFELRDGVFKKLCKDAERSPDRSFYLIIDEINRGDIPRIFGELLTVLEKDKRGKRVVLPVSQENFVVPKNVFVLATMNTADRSISLLDAALRRRFGFVEMMPDGAALGDAVVAGISLRAWLDALNARILEHVERDARNLQIGHSYLMHAGNPLKDVAALKRAIRDDIVPLLEEYCYEDFGTLESILGKQLVDCVAQRIRHELFDDGQEADLVQSLLDRFEDISRSTGALSSEESLISSNEDELTGEEDGADE